jgi:hypothetical protein
MEWQSPITDIIDITDGVAAGRACLIVYGVRFQC